MSLFVGFKALLCHGQRTHSSSPRTPLLNRNTHAIVYPGREKKKSCWFVCLDLEILNCFEKTKTLRLNIELIFTLLEVQTCCCYGPLASNGPSITCDVRLVWFVPPPAVFSVSHLFGSSLQGEKLEVSLAPPAVF